MPKTENRSAGETAYYDSANIAESYSGIVLPLTASFAQMVYERVYRDLLRMSGVPKSLLERHAYVFSTLLGFFSGRMYYHMNSWYAMAEFVPGYRRNKENFELMITSNIKANVRAAIAPPLYLTVLYPAIVSVKVIFFGITARNFKKIVATRLEELRLLDFNALDYEACVGLLGSINKDLLHRWYVTLENDFFVMTYLGLLKKLLGEEDLQQYLIFESKATKQVDALRGISSEMAAVPDVWDALEKGSAEAFYQSLGRHPRLEKAFDMYLSVFGGRFANELKLESESIDEDPEKLFSLLEHYRSLPASRHVPPPLPKLPWAKKIYLAVILYEFKKYAARREEFRLLRSNTFAMARKLFRRMGDILEEKGMLAATNDVFYLELSEVLSAFSEGSGFIEQVRERKKEYASYGAVNPPSHFSLQSGEKAVFDRSSERKNMTIEARPASPGIIRGRVKIFREFSMPRNIDFDILVTSHTDPGWTSLIALSKGLIIEHGGVLSHASIVARELGIPAIIGATGAMDTLTDGDIVEIDGATGAIRIM